MLSTSSVATLSLLFKSGPIFSTVFLPPSSLALLLITNLGHVRECERPPEVPPLPPLLFLVRIGVVGMDEEEEEETTYFAKFTFLFSLANDTILCIVEQGRCVPRFFDRSFRISSRIPIVFVGKAVFRFRLLFPVQSLSSSLYFLRSSSHILMVSRKILPSGSRFCLEKRVIF